MIYRPSAFSEINRVLKPDGKVALAELMKKPNLTPYAARKIQEMEKIQSDLTQLTFHIPFTTYYETIMAQAGFKNIHIIETYEKVQSREMIKAIGGWKNLWKISKWMLKIIWKSPKLRHDFIKQGEVKRVIIRDKRTAKFIIQAVMIGEKTN